MKTAAILLASIALTATLAAGATPAPRVVTTRIGETVSVHGIRLTPLRVLEDSRCPQNARCVWGGRVRLSVRMGGIVRELTLGQPVPVAGGTMQLAAVLPERKTQTGAIRQSAYRLGFMYQSRGKIELIGN